MSRSVGACSSAPSASSYALLFIGRQLYLPTNLALSFLLPPMLPNRLCHPCCRIFLPSLPAPRPPFDAFFGRCHLPFCLADPTACSCCQPLASHYCLPSLLFSAHMSLIAPNRAISAMLLFPISPVATLVVAAVASSLATIVAQPPSSSPDSSSSSDPIAPLLPLPQLHQRSTVVAHAVVVLPYCSPRCCCPPLAFFPWPGEDRGTHSPGTVAEQQEGTEGGAAARKRRRRRRRRKKKKKKKKKQRKNKSRTFFVLVFACSDHGGGRDARGWLRGFFDDQGIRTSLAVGCPRLRRDRGFPVFQLGLRNSPSFFLTSSLSSVSLGLKRSFFAAFFDSCELLKVTFLVERDWWRLRRFYLNEKQSWSRRMLAGCSSTLLSPRHKLRIDASVQLQACHFQLQDKHCHPQQKMGTQRLDLPCGFSSRKDPLRMALSVEKPPPAEARRSSCSFRRKPVTTSSMAAQSPSWGGIDEGHGRPWDRRRSLKRFHERGSCDDDRAKRTRTGGGVSGLVEVDGEVWLPRSTQEPPPVEEDKVFLVPNEASFPLPASTSHALVGGSAGPENDGLSPGEDPNDKSQSDSSSSSAAYASSPEPTKDSSGNVASNGSRMPSSSAVADAAGGEGEGSSAEQQGLELLSLLTSCAESISSGNYEGMTFFLARLGETATPLGTPLHRVVAYYTEALALRVVKLRPHIFSIAPPKSLVHPTEDDDAVALRLVNCVTPVLKFLHFTMNERLLKAFEGRDRVHIIDLDIKQGLQWPSLLQSLASRPSPPSHLRITGVGESRQDLQDTGAALARLAESLNLPFEFHAVADRLEDVRLWMLHVKREECVAVNCVLTMHKTLSDESGKALMDLLGLIRSTRPEIVVMAEQEAKHNDPNWETRLSRSLSYYAAIFDSMDYALPRDSPARIKVEQVFAREIRNVVACERGERTERHENFDRWRKLMEDGGFKCLGIGEREMLQSRMILRMYSCDKYAIDDNQGEEGDGLTLRWSDQPLYTVSAWAPTDVAGGSSSTSQPN
ncbi:hypothetical protein BHE74_00026067 [Ensete ventricosum]|nr:hypothetical protein BHE74_00026067 [Ensete ventricosum]